MKKVRISCDVTLKVRQHLDAQAKENGISRAKFIETAVQDKIEGFNVHKENKRLTEAHAQAERDILAEEQRAARLKDERDRLASEKEQLTVKTHRSHQRDRLRPRCPRHDRAHQATHCRTQREMRAAGTREN